MKILIITDSFNYCCGRSKHIFLLAKYYKRAGHRVRVVIGGGDAEDLLRAEQIEYCVMASILHRNRTVLNYLVSIASVARMAHSSGFDIVHAHHPYGSSIARFATKFYRIPHVYTIHGAVNNYGKLPFYVGDSFIAVSRATKEFVVSQKKAIREKIETISNGIDLHCPDNDGRQEVRCRHGFSPDSVVVGIIGRIVTHKGHELLLSALNKLTVRHPNVSCLIVGGGNHMDAVKTAAYALPMNVIFTGSVPDVGPYLAASDMIVIPSLSNEGLPMILLEAGKYAKPVVATAIEGMTEVITNAENGLLTVPGDISQLASTMSALIDDRPMRMKMGGKLRCTVEQSFSVEVMAKKTLEHYARLISRRRGVRR